MLDFGIAKILDTGSSGEEPELLADPLSVVTRAGTFVGTPAYMAPEQCGLLPVDQRADLYTCGVLLFQLVTGRLPFEGETPLTRRPSTSMRRCRRRAAARRGSTRASRR